MKDATINIKKDNKLSQLKAILYLLQTNLKEFKDEVDASYKLIQMGEKNQLSKKLEQQIDDPIKDVFGFSSKVDYQVNQIIDKVIRGFFKKNKSLIENVYKTKKNPNDLHYSIVLRDDNLKNRTLFFSFIDEFDLIDTSQRYPIYFQFISKDFISKLNYDEEIKLE